MSVCNSCGGIIGRDCFNPQECAWITQQMHLCGNMRAKDGNIRQAIIDRYGTKERAIGRKASPGPLYGMSGDCWAALAVAITWWETCRDLSPLAGQGPSLTPSTRTAIGGGE